jgi:hypothetical protein
MTDSERVEVLVAPLGSPPGGAAGNRTGYFASGSPLSLISRQMRKCLDAVTHLRRRDGSRLTELSRHMRVGPSLECDLRQLAYLDKDARDALAVTYSCHEWSVHRMQSSKSILDTAGARGPRCQTELLIRIMQTKTSRPAVFGPYTEPLPGTKLLTASQKLVAAIKKQCKITGECDVHFVVVPRVRHVNASESNKGRTIKRTSTRVGSKASERVRQLGGVHSTYVARAFRFPLPL